MSKEFLSQSDLDASLERLIALDPDLQGLAAKLSPIALRQRPAGLAGLLQIILGQQVSVASAQAIWARFEARFPDCDIADIAAASEEDLRACALSRPKIRTVRAIVKAIHDGFDLTAIASQPAEVAKAKLVSLHGVGPWTADIYMLFCLGEQNVFPAGDLALQVAVQSHLGLDQRPTEKALAKLAKERWSPEQGAAAHLFWAFYRDLKKGCDGVV